MRDDLAKPMWKAISYPWIDFFSRQGHFKTGLKTLVATVESILIACGDELNKLRGIHNLAPIDYAQSFEIFKGHMDTYFQELMDQMKQKQRGIRETVQSTIVTALNAAFRAAGLEKGCGMYGSSLSKYRMKESQGMYDRMIKIMREELEKKKQHLFQDVYNNLNQAIRVLMTAMHDEVQTPALDLLEEFFDNLSQRWTSNPLDAGYVIAQAELRNEIGRLQNLYSQVVANGELDSSRSYSVSKTPYYSMLMEDPAVTERMSAPTADEDDDEALVAPFSLDNFVELTYDITHAEETLADEDNVAEEEVFRTGGFIMQDEGEDVEGRAMEYESD
ncbi:hypothetical protein HDV00_005668 [Rhizophlyctis rosea]|nr:hypothetical protein HDV00_005668 [Rhizophlyctis rosea]